MRILASLLFAAAGMSAAERSPAELRIAAAERASTSRPRDPQSLADLALAYARRARETADTAFYSKAEGAIARALTLDPQHFEARKVRVCVLLGQHQFARARGLAQQLNREVPDDVQVYGFLVDAYAELGDYKAAEEAAQWMLDLRPGTVPGLTRAAYLRELFGDIEGALEAMGMAFQRTPPNEREDRAWILTQVARLHLQTGATAPADQALAQALELFPGYHYALAALAQVRTRQGRLREAAELQQRRYAAAPHPENLFELAEALQRAGERERAAEAFTRFETAARAEMESEDNANRELVFYYADHARKPTEALRIARLEAGRRADVHTLAALAWALHVAGKDDEARLQMRKALAIGTRDPELLSRAKAIGA